jgi:hypothetical protein
MYLCSCSMEELWMGEDVEAGLDNEVPGPVVECVKGAITF